MGDINLVEPASSVGPAGDFNDGSSFVKRLKTNAGIGLESALVVREMPARVLALTVRRVGEPQGRRSRVG